MLRPIILICLSILPTLSPAFDFENGEEINEVCAGCHGRDGMGDKEKAVPMLAGQYTNYLWRQMKKYREKIRIHDEDAPDDELLSDFTDDELTDIFAYLSILDD
ncbi:MAG: c-type cytochrome [Candidatus Thiodiazotropha sp.]